MNCPVFASLPSNGALLQQLRGDPQVVPPVYLTDEAGVDKFLLSTSPEVPTYLQSIFLPFKCVMCPYVRTTV